eukprot:jgi/Phyca11/18967/fgenesh1_pg.PHYCAscaffold_42_\
MFEQSRMYMDEDELLELRRKPPVAFVVRNATGKEEELQTATTTGETTAKPSKRRQSWHSRLHVPLSHPTSNMTQKPSKLTPMQTLEAPDQLSHSAFVEKLRGKNKELFNRLVQRFAALRRVSIQEQSERYDPESPTDNNATNSKFSGVENAILFFLDAKHKRDVLYFKRKNAKAPATTGKYLPYDLERIDETPQAGAGDYFMMTSTSLEHQKEELTTTEMKLIDAKEKLLTLMEEMVQQIFDDLEPPTSLDELYSAEASSVRMINAKWKSAPITAMRRRRNNLQRQKDTATIDMALLDTYIRMVDYMFTETRLIRLVSNFHFTKNAITWSNNRGTGVLAIRATIILEDRPQLIEFFCEQMKQVRMLKDGEKQLNQNIRNVDETVRALKRFAPPLGSEVSPQYNVMHQFLGKYTALVQSHAKFAAKVLPNITYQVNTVLQKYSLRCQKLLKMYDEFCELEEEEDMEKNVGTFQEVVKELTDIEKATKLYQEYQKMVGLKVVDIPSLAEAMAKWGENVIDYLRKLSLVKDMAQPWVQIHHWKEILKLMDILNYVSSIGVLITDGYTHSVTEASFEFQAIDRKWRGMMHAAKGTSSLSLCLREVVTTGFLVGAQDSYAKLWLQLGAYLDEKRNQQ